MDLNNKTILISRVDSIGDVSLTLPLCVWLKQQYPLCKVVFLGNTYTKPIIACVPQIDEVIEWAELQKLSTQEQVAFIQSKQIDVAVHVFPNKAIARLMKQAQVPIRIGTSHRLFHWYTCNVKPSFSRKKSNLHESQLNFELLKPLGLTSIPGKEDITAFMQVFTIPQVELPHTMEAALESNTVILHCKSQGSAVEWPLEKYKELAQRLLEKNYTVLFTGTEKEGLLVRPFIPNHTNCVDTTGKLSLPQLIKLISRVKHVVACSTGPLHIAGLSGTHAIGLYSCIKPMHAGRWSPIGKNVTIISDTKTDIKKEQNKLETIGVNDVLNAIIAH